MAAQAGRLQWRGRATSSGRDRTAAFFSDRRANGGLLRTVIRRRCPRVGAPLRKGIAMNRGFLKAGHLPTLFAAFLYFDLSFMVWVLLGPLGVQISKDLGLTP